MSADLAAAMTEAEQPDDAPAPPLTVKFYGVEYRLRDRVPVICLMRFLDSDGTTGDAMRRAHRFIRDVLDPADFGAFEQACIDNDASFDQILDAAVEAATARPTGQPPDSQDGPSSTGPSSRADSPSSPGGWPTTIPLPPPDLRAVPGNSAQEHGSYA
jgi:hypothetical protein